MYIAILDDDLQERKHLAEVLEKYAAARRLPVRYQLFSNGESALCAARAERFSHYFLDVMMPGMNGLIIAEEIRSFDADAKIVFLTSFQEYAYQSYRVRAYDYLLKPIREDQLFELLDRLQALENSAEECISVQAGRSVFRIPYSRLSYLEVNQKRLNFHMADGQLRQVSGTMAEFERELLSRPEFAKIHRSYIVNLAHVSTFSPDGCIMFSGENLPISRLLYNDVRKKYMAHLFGDGEV